MNLFDDFVEGIQMMKSFICQQCGTSLLKNSEVCNGCKNSLD